jgi:hypothetical protein
MTVDFTQPVFSMPDGSYVVTTQGPAYPYNVLPSDPMWQSIQDWLAAGNVAQPYVPPAPEPLDPEIQLNAEIMASLIEDAKAKPEWQARKAELIKEET